MGPTRNCAEEVPEDKDVASDRYHQRAIATDSDIVKIGLYSSSSDNDGTSHQKSHIEQQFNSTEQSHIVIPEISRPGALGHSLLCAEEPHKPSKHELNDENTREELVKLYVQTSTRLELCTLVTFMITKTINWRNPKFYQKK